MRTVQKLTLIATAALLWSVTGTSFAQGPPPPPPVNPQAVKDVFALIDANKDGKLSLEEVQAWAVEAMPPGPQGRQARLVLMMRPMPPRPPGPLPEPPPCSEDLKNSEQLPQATNVPCNGKEGNLLFRTVCNTAGYDQVAITLPAGRAAGCFGIEAITRNRVVWGIRVEGGADVYNSGMGPGPLAALTISDTAPSATGKYTVYLDMARSDPNARITVRFVDYPK